MTHDMRNLEQIQEREAADDSVRRVGVFILAACCTLGLVYGLGTLLGGRANDTGPADPLAALGEDVAARTHLTVEETVVREPIDRTELDFHEAILGDERRDEDASVREARREYASLGRMAPAIPPGLEVSELVGPAASAVMQGATRDPLLAAAIPALPSEPREPSAEGQDGEFTLQIASFRLEDEAEAFASTLRQRGHEAFVMRAEIEGRGTFYRVRVGPFDNMGQARRYRRTFEGEERMDSYVVRNRDFDNDDEESAES